MSKLTETFVSRLPTPSQKESIVWDAALTGFGLRVSPKGRKSYFVQYRFAGRTRRYRIGTHPKMKAEQARSEALQILGRADAGKDPSAERKALQRARSIRDLARDYLEQHGAKKRPGSLRNDRSMLNRIILPAIGNRLISDVGRRDVQHLHHSLRNTPYQANRVLALLSKMFSLSIQWELRHDNPARGIGRFPESAREVWLSDQQIARLMVALEKSDSQKIANAIRLLILTGARRTEVLSATWDQFDLSKGTWTKPSHHTKQKRVSHIPLSAPCRALLQCMAEAGNNSPHLFPGNVSGKPLQDIKKFWRTICAEAQLEGVRIHDLRHTFASHLAASNVALHLIGKLLGHTQVATTQKYAHLADDPLRQVSDQYGEKLTALARGKTAEIIPLVK